ncbi:MAG: hypothetical protein ACI8SE_002284 [Bacteroidia bacterium]|jgi:hypothetical protein
MRRTRLTIVLTLLFCVFAQAQDTINCSKVQIGSNLSSLIQEINRPTLVATYNYRSNNFARIQFGFSNTSGNLETDLNATNSQNNSLAGDTNITNSPYSNNNLGLQLGYYRTTKLDGSFSIYYGLDFLLQREVDFHELNLKTKREFSQQQVQFFDTREKITTTTVGFGIAPMFGIQYQISERIQIGYEMHVSVLMNDFKQEVKRTMVQTSSFDPRVFETTVVGDRSWNQVTNVFNPLSGLFLSFRL